MSTGRNVVLLGIALAVSTAVAVGGFAGPDPQRSSGAQSDVPQGPPQPVRHVSIKNDLSPRLDSITPIPPAKGREERERINRMPPNRARAAAAAGALKAINQDPVVQMWQGLAPMPSPTVNVDGVNNVNGVYPPDTQGDVGPNHYVQWVNLSFAIYNKTGTKVYPAGPGFANGNTLWSGFGGACETSNDGDPITLYDTAAGRWLMSQFALPNYPNGPFYQCTAISLTSDPTGSWYRYQWQVPSNKMNDYPKIGVWPDGYYMTVNQFTAGSGFWGGAGVVAFERAKMLAGLPAQSVYFDLYSIDPNLGGMLPSDLDGATPPPAGSPNYVLQVDDDALGYPSDQLEIFKFHVDWTTPASSTFTGPTIINLTTLGYPFDSNLCGFARSCIPQPGTAQGLDAISDRLLYRLAYRNFGDHESLVMNHTVDVGVNHAGIRWYELRGLSGTPTVYQGGTYAPDADHRWMGSIAMDAVGDIALGFSVSSGATFPSVRYVGRLASDPLGTLPQSEVTLIAGSGSQTGTANRWGDYSMMGIDPVDDCTFWYTQEYLATTGGAPWRTRIGAFKFPTCNIAGLTPPNVTLNPGNQTVGYGALASFNSTADGNPTPTVQWQVNSPRPGVWFDIPGATSLPLTFTADLADSGRQYRAVFTNAIGSATSTPAMLTVVTNPAPPVITLQPVGMMVANGGTASFTAAATGGPLPTMQWQVGTPGGGSTTADSTVWSNIPGATSSPLTFDTALADNQKLYRAVFTNASGTATTQRALLSVVASMAAPVVTTSPVNQTVASGGTANFTAAATGDPTPTVQWQTAISRGSWVSIPGATGTAYSLTVASTDNGRQYRAVFTNAAGSATSASATLTVTGLAPVGGSPAALKNEGGQVPGFRTSQARTAVVNFAALAQQEAVFGPPAMPGQGIAITHRQPPEPDPDAIVATPAPVHPDTRQLRTRPPSLASPPPAVSFAGLDDIPAVGSGFSYIPPDTDGAVGLTRIFNTLNNNYRVLDKATGATISTVSMAGFWAGTGATNPFDPKTLYDPYNNRFIVTAVSDAVTPASSVLVGVSDTSDPDGTWHLFRYQICSTAACGSGTEWWGDFPCIGFNKNWVAVSVNLFDAVGAFHESRILAVDYATLRSGTFAASLFTGLTDFTIQPAVTYSATENTLYAPAHWSSGGRSYHLTTITGTAGTPVFTQGPLLAHTVLGAWQQPGGDILPQAPEPGTAATAFVDSGTARIVNAVFRDGSIWYAQTVGLPLSGMTHTAAQWVRLDTTGAFVDGGRVEDPTATSSNGGKWYSYPSIAVNATGDAVVGFSQFSSSQYPSAGYAFRDALDPAGTMRDPVVAKAGEGFYYKTYSGTQNRWGDFSMTQVDPVDDNSLWSVQEYSKAQVGTGNGSGRWGTWWVNVVPPSGAPVVETHPGSQSVGYGATASFTSTAVGGLPIAIQWQVNTPRPGFWLDINGATSSPLTFTAALADTGKQYRAVFTNSVGSATSDPATLTVVTSPAPPVITSQPSGQIVIDGAEVSFSAAAAGGPAPTIQWQVGVASSGNNTADGITWSDLPGATSSPLTFTAALGDHQKLYRAVFTNASGTATTVRALLLVVASMTAPVVTTPPADQTVAAGGTATFTAAATGDPTPTVQWQTGIVRGMWVSIPGATGTTYSFTVASTDNGRQYRAVFTNAAGSATTTAALLTVTASDAPIVEDTQSQTPADGAARGRSDSRGADGGTPHTGGPRGRGEAGLDSRKK